MCETQKTKKELNGKIEKWRPSLPRNGVLE
jgi:hypothetical protein